jgi:uncharacterized protein YkwD
MKNAALLILLLAAGPQRRPPALDIAALEGRVHALVNAERQLARLDSLQTDERLNRIARRHSEDMAKRRFFSHVNPDGQDPTERARVGGYVCRKQNGKVITQGVAENLAMGYLYSRAFIRGNQTDYEWKSPEAIAAESVKNWMASDGHRRNILDKNYTLAGMGVAIDEADKKVYVTQVFC